MIKLENLKGHDTMCGGYTYTGYISFDGITVKEVLEEIREYYSTHGNETYDEQGKLWGKKGKHGSAWGITINEIPYLGTWNNWTNEYKHQFDNLRVKKIYASGGWYCSYDFDIVTYKENENEVIKND